MDAKEKAKMKRKKKTPLHPLAESVIDPPKRVVFDSEREVLFRKQLAKTMERITDDDTVNLFLMSYKATSIDEIPDTSLSGAAFRLSDILYQAMILESVQNDQRQSLALLTDEEGNPLLSKIINLIKTS